MNPILADLDLAARIEVLVSLNQKDPAAALYALNGRDNQQVFNRPTVIDEARPIAYKGSVENTLRQAITQDKAIKPASPPAEANSQKPLSLNTSNQLEEALRAYISFDDDVGFPAVWTPQHIGLLPQHRMHALAGFLSGQLSESNLLDTEKIVERLAVGKPLRQVSRLKKRTNTRKVLILEDCGSGMQVFQRDVGTLEKLLKRYVDAEHVSKHELDFDHSKLDTLFSTNRGGLLIVTTDFGDGWRMRQRSVSSQHNFSRIVRRAAEHDIGTIFLSPLTARKRQQALLNLGLHPIKHRVSIAAFDHSLNPRSIVEGNIWRATPFKRLDQFTQELKYLLFVMTLAEDGDARLLRAVRIALSYPEIFRSARYWTKADGTILGPIRVVGPLNAVRLTAVHEHAFWNLPIFHVRGEQWSYDREQVDIYLDGFSPGPDQEVLVDFAKQVQQRYRIVRPVDVLIKDQEHLLRIPSEEARLNRINQGGETLTTKASTTENAHSKVETVRVRLLMHRDKSQSLRLEKAARQGSGKRFELITRNGRINARIAVFRDFACDMPLPVVDLTDRPLPITLSHRDFKIDDEGAKIRLDMSGISITDRDPDAQGSVYLFSFAEDEPARILQIPSHSKLPDPKNILMCSGIVYDEWQSVSVWNGGRKDSQPPRSIPKDTVPEASRLGVRPRGDGFAAVQDSENWLHFSDGAGNASSLLLTTLLPNESAERQVIAWGNGRLATMDGSLVRHIELNKDIAEVTQYQLSIPTVCSMYIGCVSACGVLVAQELQTQTNLFLLPPAEIPKQAAEWSETSTPVAPIRYGVIPHGKDKIESIAIDDAGYIACRLQGGEIDLYEPLTRTEPLSRQAAEAGRLFNSSAADKDSSEARTDFLRFDGVRIKDVFDTSMANPEALLMRLLLSPKTSPQNAEQIINVMRRRLVLDEQRFELEIGDADIANLVSLICSGVSPRTLALILRAPIDVNSVLPGSGLTPAFLGAFAPNAHELMPVLINAGADVNALDPFGRNMLFFATRANDGGPLVNLLLDAGADASVTVRIYGRTVGFMPFALWTGAKTGETPNPLSDETVLRLIDAGADCRAVSEGNNWSPLMAATFRNNVELLERVADAGPRLTQQDLDHPAAQGFTPLIMAAFADAPIAIEWLLHNGATVDLTFNNQPTALSVATQHSYVECIKLLLEAGANPNPVNGSALDGPVQHGSDEKLLREVVELLLDYSANPLRQGSVWFKKLLAEKKEEAGADNARIVLDILQSRGKPIDPLASLLDLPRPYQNVLGFAKLFDSAKVGLWDVNTRDRRGRSFLHYLAARGETMPEDEARTSLLDQALAAGADATGADKDGATALHFAVLRDDKNMVEKLLEAAPETQSALLWGRYTPRDIANRDEISDLFDGDASEYKGRGQQTRDPDTPSATQLNWLTFLSGRRSWLNLPIRALNRPAVVLDEENVRLNEGGREWQAIYARSHPAPYIGRDLLETWWKDDTGTIGVSGYLTALSGEAEKTLDGTSPPIHRLNARQLPKLESEEDALTYLIFFCNAVHGEDGPFSVVMGPEDVCLRADADQDAQKAIAEIDYTPKIAPLKDGWSASVKLLYSNALFGTEFKVQQSGLVEMQDDEPLLADLPILKFSRDGNIFFRER